MLTKLTKIKRLLLIGKEIWHNKRSMRGRFIIYLLSLVLLAGSAMLILLNVIGIVQPPSHDIDDSAEFRRRCAADAARCLFCIPAACRYTACDI